MNICPIFSSLQWTDYLGGGQYLHGVVKHKIKEYVRGDVHVNSLEGAWSLLKRSMMVALSLRSLPSDIEERSTNNFNISSLVNCRSEPYLLIYCKGIGKASILNVDNVVLSGLMIWKSPLNAKFSNTILPGCRLFAYL
jgi:hypothetical protein